MAFQPQSILCLGHCHLRRLFSGILLARVVVIIVVLVQYWLFRTTMNRVRTRVVRSGALLNRLFFVLAYVFGYAIVYAYMSQSSNSRHHRPPVSAQGGGAGGIFAHLQDPRARTRRRARPRYSIRYRCLMPACMLPRARTLYSLRGNGQNELCISVLRGAIRASTTTLSATSASSSTASATTWHPVAHALLCFCGAGGGWNRRGIR